MIPLFLIRWFLQARICIATIDIEDTEALLRNRLPHQCAGHLVSRLADQYIHRQTLIEKLESLK